jgi:putative aldouronate transport system substrate-binding protein
MSMTKRPLSAILPALLLAIAASGSLAALDTAKRVEIRFCMLGDPPKDLPLIQAEVNKMAVKELNATVKYEYIPWEGWDKKYEELLDSGQAIDLVFTSDWTRYQYFAKRGAFMPLDGMVEKASPELAAFVPKEYWDAVRIGGKIYTIPATWKEYITEGIVYREDLRKKYRLPKPEGLAGMEAYFDGIRKYEPDMQPIGQTSGFPMMGQPILLRYPGKDWAPVYGHGGYGFWYDYAAPSKLTNYFESPEFRKDARLFKRWADKGFWSKDALTVGSPAGSMDSGRVAALVDGQNAVKFATLVSRTKTPHPNWEFAYIPYVEATGLVHPVHPIHNGFAVPRNAKNPERAIALYAKMVLDKRYNYLTEYGIEGRNYDVGPDGHYRMIGDAATNGFPREAMNGWAWRNPRIQLFDTSFDIPFKMFKEWDKIATPNINDGFAEDASAYKAEAGAYRQAFLRYGLPIYYGLAGDPDEAVDKLLAELKAIGWDRIKVEYARQWLEYCKEHGLK